MPETPKKENIREVPATDALRENFMPYALSVIVSRAIPEIDGFKPSHRKLLYTMYEMGLLTGPRTKSANVAARTMLLNPHGDSSNYEAMVRLTQHNETLLAPFVDGKGSFGKHYSRDTAPAAARYTEARLAPIAAELFRGIRKNAVDFVDNYDSTRKEPTLLPVTFPNILANPTEGIAVGMASSIPSFNLSELCDAAVLRVRDPQADVRSVMPAPDFTTGAELIVDDAAMEKIYETGRGSFRMRSRYSVDTKARVIEVTEIPYSTTAEAIIDGIIALAKKGSLKEVSDVRDETGLDGLKIAIDYKRGTDPAALMRKLFRLTKLEDSYSCNMTVLVDGSPREAGVTEILDEWIRWRRGCVERELAFDLEKKKRELHLLEGLAKVLADLDEAVRIIRETPKDAAVVPNLMEGFLIDEVQAEYVAEIKLRNLNRDYVLERTKEIGRLEGEIARISGQIGNEKEIGKLVVAALSEVKKKYGLPRKTELVRYEPEEKTATGSDAGRPVRVFRTREGYLKKIPLSSLRGNPDIRTKDSDEIVQEFDTSEAAEILVFGSGRNVYKIPLSALPDSKPSDLGAYAAGVCGMDEGEKTLFACAGEYGAGKQLLIVFADGKAARMPLDVYETKTNRRKIVNAFGGKAEPLAFFATGSESDLFGILTGKGFLLLFNAGQVPLKTTKSTQGVQAVRLRKGDSPVRAAAAEAFGVPDADKYTCSSLPAPAMPYKAPAEG